MEGEGLQLNFPMRHERPKKSTLLSIVTGVLPTRYCDVPITGSLQVQRRRMRRCWLTMRRWSTRLSHPPQTFHQVNLLRRRRDAGSVLPKVKGVWRALHCASTVYGRWRLGPLIGQSPGRPWLHRVGCADVFTGSRWGGPGLRKSDKVQLAPLSDFRTGASLPATPRRRRRIPAE